jgi:hypothetical protein
MASRYAVVVVVVVVVYGFGLVTIQPGLFLELRSTLRSIPAKSNLKLDAKFRPMSYYVQQE